MSTFASPVVQLPERAEKRASPMKKSLPFFGSTEYGDGAGAPKEFEHCPVEDIIQAAIDPEPAFRAPGAKPGKVRRNDGVVEAGRTCVAPVLCVYRFVSSHLTVCFVCSSWTLLSPPHPTVRHSLRSPTSAATRRSCSSSSWTRAATTSTRCTKSNSSSGRLGRPVVPALCCFVLHHQIVQLCYSIRGLACVLRQPCKRPCFKIEKHPCSST